MRRDVMQRFLLGQTFCDGKLIISLPFGPNGEDEVHLVDSDRALLPLTKAVQRYPSLKIGAEVRRPNARAMIPSRWRLTAVNSFLAATTSTAPKAAYAEVDAFLRRYYGAAKEAHYLVLALYVLASYLFTLADTVAYLSVVGEPGTGKTLLGELLEAITFNGRMAASVTAAAIFHYLGMVRSTLIIDEQNRGDRRWTEIARAGYRKSGRVAVVDRRVDGVREWDCFGPKVFLSNEPLHDDALQSRTIQLLSESSAGPRRHYSSRTVQDEAADIRDLLYCFALDHAPAIGTLYDAQVPIDGLADRDQDLAALLLCVAGHIDAQPGQSTTLRADLVAFLSSVAEAKRRARTVDSERLTYCRLILEFENHHAKKARPDGSFLAADFAGFIEEVRLLPRPQRQKEISEKLRRWELADRDIRDVEPEVDAGHVEEDVARSRRRRKQRPVYRFDVARARRLLGETA